MDKSAEEDGYYQSGGQITTQDIGECRTCSHKQRCHPFDTGPCWHADDTLLMDCNCKEFCRINIETKWKHYCDSCGTKTPIVSKPSTTYHCSGCPRFVWISSSIEPRDPREEESFDPELWPDMLFSQDIVQQYQ